jgi:ankyrin repeat protein
MQRKLATLLPLLGLPIFLAGAIFICYMILRPIPYGPLQSAASRGDLDAVKSLIGSGTPIDERCAFRNWTALHAAVARGQFETAQYLIDHGANLELKDESGFTPLALAGCDSNYRQHSKDTEFGRNEIGTLLIKRGANVNATTNDGETPRGCAADGDDQGLAKIILDAGGH